MKEIEIKSAKESFLDEMERAMTNSLPVSWDEEQKKKSLARTTSHKIKSAAFTAIPMICTGSKCPFKNTCEFYKEGSAPVDNPCPYELGMVATFMADYIDQLNVDPENWVELSQVRDLVDQEIQMIRKSKYLAKEDFIQENVVGVDSDGDPVFKKELHMAVELEDRLHRRRQQLFKQILATREAKVKAGAAQVDSAQGIANVISQYRKFEEDRDLQLKKQLGIVDVDEYVEAKKLQKDQLDKE
jgi:hypothetical protein